MHSVSVMCLFSSCNVQTARPVPASCPKVCTGLFSFIFFTFLFISLSISNYIHGYNSTLLTIQTLTILIVSLYEQKNTAQIPACATKKKAHTHNYIYICKYIHYIKGGGDVCYLLVKGFQLKKKKKIL